MIHDILLGCVNLNSDGNSIEEFLKCDAIRNFLHPCERTLLNKMMNVINSLRDIAKFSMVYSSNCQKCLSAADPYTNGLYLKALANSLDSILQAFYSEIAILESSYLGNPAQSLLYIFHRLQRYQPTISFLKKIIQDIKLQKLHGGAILKYLYQIGQHGDKSISYTITTIQATVNIVFLKQLTHWIFHARIIDTYGEFFIQCSEIEYEKNTYMEFKKNCGSSTCDSASNYGEIWHYKIFHKYLPHCLSAAWAEKVLFIGQTVLLFKVEENKTSKCLRAWNDEINFSRVCGCSLWDNKEHLYFGKLQRLQNQEMLDVWQYDQIIDEIKNFVMLRLCEVAVNQADLEQHLKLIKQFFLLGRGELFLEFIRLTHRINQPNEAEHKIKDYVKAFEFAAHNLGISEELERFTINIPKVDSEFEDLSEFLIFQSIYLEYKVSWPLQLLFSPKVIECYNKLFRFLLLIKKVQFELHLIWCMQTVEFKIDKRPNEKVMHLRNQLMFFLDNLQYYIQVDIIEGQFSILLNTLSNKRDFELIQKAQSLFLANVLGLCFLLVDEDTTNLNTIYSSTLNHNNTVSLIINDIFHLCIDFCHTVTSNCSGHELDCKIKRQNQRFDVLIDQLITVLIGFKVAPSTSPLSQLLLRLDYNHWYGLRKKSYPCFVVGSLK